MQWNLINTCHVSHSHIVTYHISHHISHTSTGYRIMRFNLCIWDMIWFDSLCIAELLINAISSVVTVHIILNMISMISDINVNVTSMISWYHWPVTGETFEFQLIHTVTKVNSIVSPDCCRAAACECQWPERCNPNWKNGIDITESLPSRVGEQMVLAFAMHWQIFCWATGSPHLTAQMVLIKHLFRYRSESCFSTSMGTSHRVMSGSTGAMVAAPVAKMVCKRLGTILENP